MTTNNTSIFVTAKQVSLFDVWSSLHLSMKSSTGIKAHSSTCPSCSDAKSASSTKVTLNDEKGLWYCFACGAGGDVINLVKEHQGLSAIEAAEWITKQSREDFKSSDYNYKQKTRDSRPRYEINKEDRRKARALTILASEGAKRICPVTMKYLTERGISRELIKANWRKRLVGTSTIAPSKIMEIALLMLPETAPQKDKDTMYKSLLYRPLIFLYRNKSGIVTSAEFRSINKNAKAKSIRRGKAELPWILKGEKKGAVSVEGAIDAMSLRDMGNKKTIFGIPGVQNWRPNWLVSFDEWMIGLDNDKAGHLGSLKIILSTLFDREKVSVLMRKFKAEESWIETVENFLQAHPDVNINKTWLFNKRLLPKTNDWNADLKALREEEKALTIT